MNVVSTVEYSTYIISKFEYTVTYSTVRDI
jgi:hypothetical protein